MEGKQFSTSRGVVIYVGDFLDRYDADPLRYFLTAAGPETQDTDFTWAEFVRRNNDELVATWGNLVNRTLTSAYKNFGVVPAPGAAHRRGRSRARRRSRAASRRSAPRSRGPASRRRWARRCSSPTRVNQYVSEQAPWAVIKDDRERAGTILYVALRCIDNLKTLFAPFLPFSSQALHELLGYEGYLAGPLRFEEVEEADGARHTVLTGDYRSWCGRWQAERAARRAGARASRGRCSASSIPTTVVAEELARMERSAAA